MPHTKLTEELTEKIVALLKAGMFVKDAAGFCDIHRSQIYRWIERGEAEALRLIEADSEDAEPLECERIYLEFRDRVENARAYANIRDQNVMAQAAENDPVWAEKRWKQRNPDIARQEFRLEIEARTPEQVEEERRRQILDGAMRTLSSGGRRTG